MKRAFSARRFLPWSRAAEPAADEPRRTGPRIVVIGNCQARGVVSALRVLAPTARVDLVPMGGLGKRSRSLAAFARDMSAYDHVFTQPFPKGFFPDGGSAELVASLPRARAFPAIVFSAFHPDAIYVGDLKSLASTKLLPSPMHTYHSAIVLFGFLRGLDAARIVALFREDVLRRLGYLDAWNPAADSLLASGRAIGFDLSAEFVRWSRSGAFMHNINHPRLRVLGDVAARLLVESGLESAGVPLDSYLADELLEDVIWPIYEPVAGLYGIRGSYVFKRRQRQGAPPSLLDLEGFVAESLALYRRTPRAVLTNPRIVQWSKRPDICDAFDEAA